MIEYVYSTHYQADLLGHIFPIGKYSGVYERLRDMGHITDENHITPENMADWETIGLVHTDEYIDDLKNLRRTSRTLSSEMALNEEILTAFRYGTRGSILAFESALRVGCGVNIGGGLHHAYPDHAEGFCYINDIAVGIRAVQRDGFDGNIVVIDCDLHQGNGTARVFRGDERVFTFSIHQQNNYPFMKEKSDMDIGLADETGDDEYVETLERAVETILMEQKPEFVVYVAGADPYEGDQLGGLSLTIGGLTERDEAVLGRLSEAGVPVGILFAGGYAYDVRDTIEIHLNTCLVAEEWYGGD